MHKQDIDPADPRVKDAVFGKQVEDFLHSPIGSFLLYKARAEEEAAIQELKKAPPNAEHKIRELQHTIRRAESIQVWLGDAVAEGHRAIGLIDGEEDTPDG